MIVLYSSVLGCALCSAVRPVRLFRSTDGDSLRARFATSVASVASEVVPWAPNELDCVAAVVRVGTAAAGSGARCAVRSV